MELSYQNRASRFTFFRNIFSSSCLNVMWKFSKNPFLPNKRGHVLPEIFRNLASFPQIFRIWLGKSGKFPDFFDKGLLTTETLLFLRTNRKTEDLYIIPYFSYK